MAKWAELSKLLKEQEEEHKQVTKLLVDAEAIAPSTGHSLLGKQGDQPEDPN